MVGSEDFAGTRQDEPNADLWRRDRGRCGGGETKLLARAVGRPLGRTRRQCLGLNKVLSCIRSP